MHAVVVTVTIDATRTAESDEVLQQHVIPQSKAEPGCVRGMWLRTADETGGRGILIFATEGHAAAAAALIRQTTTTDQPVNVDSVETFEVVGEA